MFKKLLTPLLMASALSLSSLAHAASQPIFDFGGLNFSGLSIIDTSDPFSTRGLFVVDQTRDKETGNIVYESGEGREIVGVFGGFNRRETQAGLGGSINFTSSGGFVNFYEVAANTFQITGDYAADTAGILAGELLLGGVGHTDVNGNTAIGSVTANTYASTGSLDFIDGALLSSFNNNSVTFQGADALFNLSGSRSVLYPFQGSSDATTIEVKPIEVSQVPIPAASWLFGSALLGITGLTAAQKKKEL